MSTVFDVQSKLKAKSNCKLCLGRGSVKFFNTPDKNEKPRWEFCSCFIKTGKKLKDKGFDLTDVNIGINKNGVIQYTEIVKPEVVKQDEVKQI